MPSSPSRPCRATKATSGVDLAQARDEVVADVDADHLVAQALERVLHAGARAQRDLALQRAPALEHRDRATAPRLVGAARAPPPALASSRPALAAIVAAREVQHVGQRRDRRARRRLGGAPGGAAPVSVP